MTATRSKPGKAPHKRRTAPYSPEQRAEALRLVEAQGIAHAHRVTKVPKPTLSRWARAAGIDLEPAARARTKAAAAAVEERATRARLTTTELLEQHIETTGRYLSTVAHANTTAAELIADLDPQLIKLVATIAGTEAVIEDETAEAAQLRARALATLPLTVRDAEGILTRAIHDLQLLRGEATERGTIVVDFPGIPRPNPAAVEPVVRQIEE